tara:strand:- start:1081 stop:1371 length:291 start_codon:yes stop_codon:yes gene_type:complete
MVARPKRSIKKTVRRVIDSLKKPKTKRNPDIYKTGPRRKKKNPKTLRDIFKPGIQVVPNPKLPKDRKPPVIKNPKLPKDRKPPVMTPVKRKKPKKS